MYRLWAPDRNQVLYAALLQDGLLRPATTSASLRGAAPNRHRALPLGSGRGAPLDAAICACPWEIINRGASRAVGVGPVALCRNHPAEGMETPLHVAEKSLIKSFVEDTGYK